MRPSTRARVLCFACAVAVAGCTRGAPAPPTSPAPRIVSLSPAITRTLVDFGLAGDIVGRSRFCTAVDERVPVVGDLFEIDYERLVRLRPTAVLIQPTAADGVPAQLSALATQHGWHLGDWRFDSIDEVRRAIGQLPFVLFPEAGPRRDRADASARRLLDQIEAALTPGPEPSFAGPTLLLVSVEPVPMAAGPGSYLDDLLVALGGTNAVSARGWPQLSLEDVVRLDPQAIVVVRDHGPADVDPIEAAGAVATLDTAARRDGRIAALVHPDAMLPSSGLIGVAGAMRATLEGLADAPGAPGPPGS